MAVTMSPPSLCLPVNSVVPITRFRRRLFLRQHPLVLDRRT